MHSDRDNDNHHQLMLRVLRLEQRLRNLQAFIEDGIGEPWDKLEQHTLPQLEQRMATLEERVEAREQELGELDDSPEQRSGPP